MEITNNTNVDNKQFQTAVEKESLSNDDFMQLLLTELKYQDPTKPMDSKAMIDQTMQMSTIEANNANVKALESMQSSFSSTQMLNSINLIGKHIDTGNRNIELANSSANFSLLFDQDISNGSIYIKDSSGNIINTLDINDLKAGNSEFNWDGKDQNGNQMMDGLYTLAVDAKNVNNETVNANIGTHKVSSLDFNNGEVTLIANGYKVNLNDVKEIW